MNSNRNITIKRLIIYLVLSFLLVWIVMGLYFANGGEYSSPAMEAILAYSMLCPGIAVLVTRWITKEGIRLTGEDSLMLGISFSGKRWIWYLAAILLPLVLTDISVLAMFLIFPETYDTTLLESLGLSKNALILFPLSGIVNGVIISFGALGEEIGWRSYLYPKLEQLLGTAPAMLLGGIIWGVWHFPAIAKGHGFGTGYFGEPWTGFLVFTISTVAEGIILYYLTQKAKSIWPAAFYHAVHNCGSTMLLAVFNSDKLTGVMSELTLQLFIRDIPIILVAIICLILMCRERK